jgi:hypothetical protein
MYRPFASSRHHILLFFLGSYLPSVFPAKWADYPECARAILNEYATLSCSSSSENSTVNQEPNANACLCPNTAFITDFAQSTYMDCGCDTLEETAATFVFNCNGSGTPSAYSEPWIVSLGSNQTQGCVVNQSTTSIPTTSPTQTTSRNPDQTREPTTSGLITSDKIAVGVGVPSGVFALILVVLEIAGRLKKKPNIVPTHHVHNVIIWAVGRDPVYHASHPLRQLTSPSRRIYT